MYIIFYFISITAIVSLTYSHQVSFLCHQFGSFEIVLWSISNPISMTISIPTLTFLGASDENNTTFHHTNFTFHINIVWSMRKNQSVHYTVEPVAPKLFCSTKHFILIFYEDVFSYYGWQHHQRPPLWYDTSTSNKYGHWPNVCGPFSARWWVSAWRHSILGVVYANSL